jgi:four helix bundle protein
MIKEGSAHEHVDPLFVRTPNRALLSDANEEAQTERAEYPRSHMKQRFAHEELVVYGKSLALVGRGAELLAHWASCHAVKDHLGRALESIPMNVAEAVAIASVDGRLLRIDYAFGSSLECAACLDVAMTKELVTCAIAAEIKRDVAEVSRMLVGLRKSWEENPLTLKEDAAEYHVAKQNDEILFLHEHLDLYRVALEFVGWWHLLYPRTIGDGRESRRIDSSAASTVLNIAEGNGRFSRDDHRRFLKIAEGAAVRTACRLDIAVAKKQLGANTVAPGKQLLRRMTAMLIRLEQAFRPK